jgi:hypothetical protein
VLKVRGGIKTVGNEDTVIVVLGWFVSLGDVDEFLLDFTHESESLL